jgi:hypothetical protein
MRHSVDFGFPDTAMTQVIYCRLLIVCICSDASVSESVTPIFEPPAEMPTPCRARLGGTTLRPSESFAVCRT